MREAQVRVPQAGQRAGRADARLAPCAEPSAPSGDGHARPRTGDTRGTIPDNCRELCAQIRSIGLAFGRPPTLRELTVALAHGSTTWTHLILRRAVDLGLVTDPDGRPQNAQLTTLGVRVALGLDLVVPTTKDDYINAALAAARAELDRGTCPLRVERGAIEGRGVEVVWGELRPAIIAQAAAEWALQDAQRRLLLGAA